MSFKDTILARGLARAGRFISDGLGGALGVIVMLITAGWLPMPLGVALALCVAFYFTYHHTEKTRRRLEAENVDLRRRLTRRQWERAIELFQRVRGWSLSLERPVRLWGTPIPHSDGTTEWKIEGYDAEALRQCEDACRIAGQALKSSAVAARVPAAIIAEPDPLVRWLSFANHTQGFDFFGPEPRRVVVPLNYIEDILPRSKWLCERCRNAELYQDDDPIASSV